MKGSIPVSLRLTILTSLSLLLGLWSCDATRGSTPIKVGILHSATGSLSLNEKPVMDAALLAIAEINEQGGLLGRSVEPVVADGRSDAAEFGREAERLITEEGVCTIFGCWTSASRKSVKNVVERLDNLLFYPLQYEGLEESPNIVYTGAAPNQQIIPAIKWCFDTLGHKFFLIGSDYVFPRTANAIIKDQVAALQGEIVGEQYILLGSANVDAAVESIVRTQPDVIVNTVNGSSNIAFFQALRRAGITPARIPTMSFSVTETDMASLDSESMAGDYAAWNYFQSIESAENAGFVRRFQERYGQERVISDPMEAAYFGVLLWAQAVREAASAEPAAIRLAIEDQSRTAPEGLVYIDRDTRHTWKFVRIGRVRPDGQFDIVWNSGVPVRPVPFPRYRHRAEWQSLLDDMYKGWGGNWANPGTQ
ncbi:MAG: urea ABC transporter substrate-binding protein [Acidobacteria bacterium]|nr:urea ABC transporter substrate-binding protein [Acidobacteriota bacterium]